MSVEKGTFSTYAEMTIPIVDGYFVQLIRSYTSNYQENSWEWFLYSSIKCQSESNALFDDLNDDVMTTMTIFVGVYFTELAPVIHKHQLSIWTADSDRNL